MKKLLLLIPIVLSFFVGLSQPPITRGSNANTIFDTRVGALKNMLPPTYYDTTEANLPANIGLDSVGALIYTNSDTAYWLRAENPKRWIQVGRKTSFQSSNSILVSGDGSPPDPYIPTLIPSNVNNNAIVIFPDGVFVPTQVQNGLISGGILTWVSGYTYDVSPAQYGIANVVYNTLQDQITFAAADTLPRIDEAAVDINEAVVIIQGTPSELPTQEPSYDPATQVPLAFVSIDSNSTAPPNINEEYIYRNNVEWTTTTSNVSRINPDATNNPYSATKNIRFLLSQSGDSIGFKAPTTPIWSDFTVITFKIFSNNTWGANSSIILQWYSGTAAVGNPIFLSNNVYGFISSNNAVYQTITIRLSDFNNISTANDLRITFQGFGGQTISPDIDDIRLLGGDGVIIPQVGDDWHVGGNILASTGRFGSLTPNNVDVITGNTVKATFNNTTSAFELYGQQWMRGANPGISFQLGSFANADYFLRRIGTDLITNTAGTILDRFQGTTVHSWIAASGDIWNTSAGVFSMQLDATGNLLLGTNANNATTIFNVTSTTKASHPFPSQTNTQMLAIATPQTGDLVYNSTNTNPYFYNGAAWVPLGGVSANNGLSTSSATNVQLGGSALLGNTSILTSAFSLTIPSSNASSTLIVTNSNAGSAINATSTGGIGVFGTGNSSGYGVVGISSTGTGVQAFADAGLPLEIVKNTSTTNAVVLATQILVQSTGTPANGLGGSFDFRVGTATVNDRLSNQFISRWTNATDVARVSEASITGVDAGVTATLFTLSGSGATALNKYGVGTFTGTPAYNIQVDASGNLIESAVTGGGMTNPMTTTGDIIYSSDNSGTPERLGIGSPGDVLVVSAGGIPEWGSIAGSGTVTDVSFTGGLISVATSTSTPALTVAGTSGGGVYFSSASTWASTAALAANAIMIGGGAGAAYSTTTTGTGVLTALGINVGSAGAFITFNGAGGTPSSLTLTNATGLPLSTGITGTLADDNGGTGQSTYAQGDMIYASAVNTLSKLTIGTSGQVLRVSAGGLPEYATISGSGTLVNFAFTNANGFTGSVANPTISPNLTIGTNQTGILNGNGTSITGITSSTIDQILRVTGANTFAFGAVNLQSANAVSGTLQPGSGGTGVGSPFNNGILLIGNGTGFTKATLTAGTGILITNGAGSVTVSSDYARVWITVTESGSTINWNTTTGANARVTLAGTGRTLNIQNPIDGYTYTLKVIQGTGGLKTITTWTNVKWPNGGTLPDLSDAVNQYDIFQFKYESSTGFFYGSIGLNYN